MWRKRPGVWWLDDRALFGQQQHVLLLKSLQHRPRGPLQVAHERTCLPGRRVGWELCEQRRVLLRLELGGRVLPASQ
ncbi:hypothetical protein [Mumia zhuanghuii]|uniref:Uncharacterized protein n=1 Tax=Mumia zhuanghuii TaxID=2585211 RepID=A0A5C4M1W2_9ACTN|nr:hypothetical protein [Mumia zhuanghuii]TNC26014.1 hypothetical protein FHE65_34765 [Mumia zhuanghuii]